MNANPGKPLPGTTPPAPLWPILVVALSGFLVGFDGSLFTGAIVFLERDFALSSMEVGWTATSHVMSATLAFAFSGPLVDRFGRRTILRMAAVLFAASSLVAAAASSFWALIPGRVLSGLGVGAVLVAAPMYIAEISPPGLRGRMVTFNQLFIVIGTFLAFSSNLAIVRGGGTQLDWLATAGFEPSSWRAMLGLGVLPAVIYLFALMFVPESPRWHAMHGRIEAARRILARAHGTEFAERELAEVRASLAPEAGKREARLRELFAPTLRGVLVIGLIVAVLQQITGINAVLTYANMIFERIAAEGTGYSASFMKTTLIGLVNLVFTVIALLLIDRIGRRPLLLFGSGTMALFLMITAYGFHAAGGALHPGWVLTGLLGFVASFAMSIGPGMWVLLSEIFPNRVRGVAFAFVGVVNSAVCTLALQLFPWQMENMGGARTFFIYGVFAVIGLVLLAKVLPETRGRSLEELEDRLVRHT